MEQRSSAPLKSGIAAFLDAGRASAGDPDRHQVALPLDAGSLNEELLQIGLWLVERQIPHRARVTMEPEHRRIRVSFFTEGDAMAFCERFALQRKFA